MSREEIAYNFVEAQQALEKARIPIRKFDNIVKSWKSQPAFSYGGVDLIMDEKAIAVFKEQLQNTYVATSINYEEAKAALNAI